MEPEEKGLICLGVRCSNHPNRTEDGFSDGLCHGVLYDEGEFRTDNAGNEYMTPKLYKCSFCGSICF